MGGGREREREKRICINQVGKNWEVGVDERGEGGQKEKDENRKDRRQFKSQDIR